MKSMQTTITRIGINSKVQMLLVICFLTIVMSCSTDNGRTILSLSSDQFNLEVNNLGKVTAIISTSNNQNFVDRDSVSSLLAIRIDGTMVYPEFAKVKNNVIELRYPGDHIAEIMFVEEDKYITLELISLSDEEKIDLVVWGPYFNTIGQTIGETVGVVRNGKFAFGIQSLNLKTLGGYPWNESDRMPAFDFISQSDPNEMHPKEDGSVLYRIEAAKPTHQGSSLQAYCRNRSKARTMSDFGHKKIVAPAYNDGGMLGTKIALFGCHQEEVLDVISKIEIKEGLPHPMIAGQWGKISPEANAAYIITNFTEANADRAIELTKKAGLKYLYHYGKTFENWGHFDLYKGEFPDGIVSLRRIVEKAEKEGVMVGTHFLSNFVSTNDPFVTPIPDQRLAKVGSSTLTKSISSKSSTIEIDSPDFFNQMENNNLKTVMVGQELIRYGSVSSGKPWQLIDCQRGAFGTKASSHERGDTISKLLDHGYKVFLTETDLTIVMSERMASLYNETGLRQISFDGLEGNRSTGLGTYGETMMPYVWYNSLRPELREHLIIDASRTTHFFWHIFTRMNWGEPWYGGFRESQTEYRFKNQAYFKRNYIPGMLGWFKMTPETSLEDIEWLLAKSAGYDAGYAFVANSDALDSNGNTDQILKLLGKWEALRLGDHFSSAQKEALRNTDAEFTLQEGDNGKLFLQELRVEILNHENKVKQPGEPVFTNFELQEIETEQKLKFIITATNSDLEEITLELNNFKQVALPVRLKEGQKIKFDGDGVLKVYNEKWRLLKSEQLEIAGFSLKKGDNNISVDCKFINPEKEALLKMEIRIVAGTEEIPMK